jgi:hypothetical protein
MALCCDCCDLPVTSRNPSKCHDANQDSYLDLGQVLTVLDRHTECLAHLCKEVFLLWCRHLVITITPWSCPDQCASLDSTTLINGQLLCCQRFNLLVPQITCACPATQPAIEHRHRQSLKYTSPCQMQTQRLSRLQLHKQARQCHNAVNIDQNQCGPTAGVQQRATLWGGMLYGVKAPLVCCAC